MFRFFRQIRHRLYQEGKASRYLGYAIGEIVLIVVGILIAVQIGDWNQNKIQHNEEKLILSALRSELLANRTNLENQTQMVQSIEAAIRGLLEKAAKPTPDLTSNSIDTMLGTGSFFSSPTTFQMSAVDAVIQGGKLSIIQNADLRQRITGWSRQVARVTRTEAKDYDTFASVWMPFLRDNAYLPQIQNAIEATPETGQINYIPEVPLSSHKTNHQSLLSDKKFQNILLHRLWDQGDILYDYQNLQPSLGSLIDLIEAELAN